MEPLAKLLIAHREFIVDEVPIESRFAPFNLSAIDE